MVDEMVLGWFLPSSIPQPPSFPHAWGKEGGFCMWGLTPFVAAEIVRVQGIAGERDCDSFFNEYRWVASAGASSKRAFLRKEIGDRKWEIGERAGTLGYRARGQERDLSGGQVAGLSSGWWAGTRRVGLGTAQARTKPPVCRLSVE